MNLRRLLPVVLAASVPWVSPCALAEETGAGVVLAVEGRPMSIDGTGMTRRARALQDIADGEIYALERGDAVTVCLRTRQGFAVSGPGTVRIDAADVAPTAGKPLIARKGPCEDASEADTDGGVILRRLSLHRRTQTLVGK